MERAKVLQCATTVVYGTMQSVMNIAVMLWHGIYDYIYLVSSLSCQFCHV